MRAAPADLQPAGQRGLEGPEGHPDKTGMDVLELVALTVALTLQVGW